MAVTILFLGPLRDLAGQETLEVDGPIKWQDLPGLVGSEVAAQLQLERVNIACAGRVLANKTELDAQDGDEIALLPPVSGG